MKKYKFTKTFTYDGKRYYIRGDTLQQCYEKWGQRFAELEAGAKRITKQMRFDDWTREWLKVYKEPTVTQETYMSYKSCIESHIFPTIGSMPLKSIRSIHCQRIVNNMSGLAHATTKKVVMLLYSIFDAAIDNDLLIENPARKLSIPKGRKDSRRTITSAERTYILKTAETHRGGLWVLLQLYCGLRPSEAAGLRWMDVNIKTKTLTVNQTIKRQKETFFIEISTKTPCGATQGVKF